MLLHVLPVSISTAHGRCTVQAGLEREDALLFHDVELAAGS